MITVDEVLEILRQKEAFEDHMAKETRKDPAEWVHRHAQDVLLDVIEQVESSRDR